MSDLVEPHRLSVNSIDGIMLLGPFRSWFDAICADDSDAVAKMLDTATVTECSLLLNGLFDYSETTQDDAGIIQLPRRPFALAAVCGSHATLKTMLNNSIGVCLFEPNGNNVIHEIVRVARVSKTHENVMSETYGVLLRLLPSSTVEKLLLGENNNHLRPLELAAKISTLRMYGDILQTPGIYLAKLARNGPLIQKWYDVTEYESFLPDSRRDNSPIKFLLGLSKVDLFSDECLALLSRAPTRLWIDAKMRISQPFVFAWFIIRISYLSAFLLFENSEFSSTWTSVSKNVTCNESVFQLPYWAGMTTTVCVFALSVLMLMVDAFEGAYFLLHNGRWRRWRTEGIISGRKAALDYNFYRIIQLQFVVMAMFRSTAWLFPVTKIPLVSELSRIVACLLMPWTLFYFVQLLPSIGYFTVSIQKMLCDMMNFLLVFLIILTPFTYIFHLMVNYHSQEGCIEQFNSWPRSFYSTFTVILNMVDFTAYRLQNPGLVYALHMIFVFTATLLLVNFLISLMSNSVDEINAHREVIMLVQRLSVAMVLEKRVGWLLKGLYGQLQDRYFTCREGHMYVVHHFTR